MKQMLYEILDCSLVGFTTSYIQEMLRLPQIAKAEKCQ